jgi:hypothetical protein
MVAALIGALFVVWRDPRGSLVVVCVAMAAAALVTRAFDDGWMTFSILGVVFVVLALGLYALYVVCGLHPNAIAAIGIGLALLVATILFRALIASGSADYPYDD